MEDILAIIFLFGGGTLGLLAFSPVGKAIAERIRGKPSPSLQELQQRQYEALLAWPDSA